MINLAGDIHNISSVTVTKAYTDRDPLAKRLVNETAEYLSTGIASIINAFNPCLIILGGGVIHGLPEYAEMIKPGIYSNALKAAVEQMHIVTASLGNKAGVIGAALLARDQIASINQ